MPMTSHFASPVAQNHISTDSTGGNFVPTLQNIEGEFLVELGKDCLQTQPYISMRTNNLARKFRRFLLNMWSIATARGFSMQNSSS